MKRVLLFLLLLPFVAAFGLAAFHAWRDASFSADHPPPGKLFGPLGSRVHVIDDVGEAPAVVFLHGNPGSALDFEPVMKKLSPKHRTLAIDRPGYGWSERPAANLTPLEQAKLVHAVVVELGLQKPVLAGFSFGGPVAVAYALEYPDEVSALVLLGAVADPVEGHHMGKTQAQLAEPWVGKAMAYVVGPLLSPQAVSDGYADAFSPLPVDPVLVERGREQFTRPSTLLASAHDWKTLETELPPLAGRYPELTVPVEALFGDGDKIVGPAHAAYLQAHVPGINVVTLQGAGHQLMSTHTDAVVAAVERALSRAK